MDEIPGIRIYRTEEKKVPFDVYFCKTKFNAYQIVMGLGQEEIEDRMAERSKKDLVLMQNMNNTPVSTGQK